MLRLIMTGVWSIAAFFSIWAGYVVYGTIQDAESGTFVDGIQMIISFAIATAIALLPFIIASTLQGFVNSVEKSPEERKLDKIIELLEQRNRPTNDQPTNDQSTANQGRTAPPWRPSTVDDGGYATRDDERREPRVVPRRTDIDSR